MTENSIRRTMRALGSGFCIASLLWSPIAHAQEPVFVPGAIPQSTPATAGTSGPSTPSGVALASGLRILVLEGRLRVNRLTEGIYAMPVVEVRDSNDRPIEGAQVIFTLPGGPEAGAAFKDGSLQKTFSTNAQGQAAADGYAPNNVAGKFLVKVKAIYNEETKEISIQQANSFQTQMEADEKKANAWKKWLWIGGAAAAGGITAAVLLNRNGSSAPSAIVVTPGQPILGGR